ncbi:hypothetical protein J2S50_000231 [Streptomyces sp. DSM 40167]|nr:hypothetical protein [Streptomyces sp. DSM 40167]
MSTAATATPDRTRRVEVMRPGAGGGVHDHQRAGGAGERGGRQRQGAEDADAEDDDRDRAEGGAGGDAEQVRLGERVADQRLKGEAGPR